MSATGDPLEQPLEEASFVALDLEATGLSTFYDPIIEIGAERFGRDGTVTGRFQEFVNPGMPIPPRITRLTGIDDSMVANARSSERVVRDFLAFLAEEPSILIAHSIATDLAFLKVACDHFQGTLPDALAVDTLPLSRRFFPEAPDHRLSSLAALLDTPEEATFHRALADAAHTRGLFLACLERAENSLHNTEDLKRYEAVTLCPPEPVSHPELPERLKGLLDFARQETPVEIIYRGGSRQPGFRSIIPQSLFEREGRLYLRAFCNRDDIAKDFRLDRINRLRKARTTDESSPESIDVPAPSPPASQAH